MLSLLLTYPVGGNRMELDWTHIM